MTASRTGAEPTRQRMLDAAVRLAAREGYGELTVERLLELAGVSRGTFYQYFDNVEDCFWDAYREHAEQLIGDVATAVAQDQRADLAMIGVLLDAATDRPEAARLVMHETLTSGPQGLRERDALVARIEQLVADAGPTELDIPCSILIGATFRFLSSRLFARAIRPDVREALLAWVGAFERGPGEGLWTSAGSSVPGRSPASAGSPASGRSSALCWAPGQTARWLPARCQQLAPRNRIMLAVAEAVRGEGYGPVTVADIIACAGVSRRQFYYRFAGKSDAFMAAYEDGFQRALAACAPVFFNADDSCEGVWQATHEFMSFFARDPALAHIGFVECYGPGRAFERQINDTQLAFISFLAEGLRLSHGERETSSSTSALTAAAMAEAAFLAVCGAWSGGLRRAQPLSAYVALAPFIGSAAAGEFVGGKLVRGPQDEAAECLCQV